jgi:PAS domain S-box-containing protein
MLREDHERPSVLIVDDEPQIATALADILEDIYTVVIETSPSIALQRLQAEKGFCVILSDQRMPGMTGDQFLAQAKDVSSATRILVTAYADISAVVQAVNQGKIFAYVTKPWDVDDIIRTVGMGAEYCNISRKIMHERTLLHQIMESSVDAIAIKDRERRYIKLNRHEAEMLGAGNPSEVEWRSAADFLPFERLQNCERDELEVLGGQPVLDRLEQVAAGGRPPRWFSSNLSPIRDYSGGVVGLVRITRDITETKRLDEMKDEFIATVRHELRTPLTAIYASLGLLRGGAAGGATEQIARLIKISHENSGRLLSLVNDLLDTVSFEKEEQTVGMEPVKVAELIDSAIGEWRTLAEEKGIMLAVAAPLPAVEIEAHRDRLLQVLAKLLSNALDVTPRGGEVRLHACIVEPERVRFSVADTGPGVPNDVVSRLFKRFSQGDSSNSRAKSGVGLGLYIAKSIIDAHHGKIDFVNRADGGAEFYFELPVLGRIQDGAQRQAAQ